ncbi:MAG: ABC transporter permease [Erysipelotrichaceae bacterium]|jgi:oligopeptide transport system permease protein|nr:ABC transporter permease [Erysipelotrichaceae bacterium]MBQ1323878.1 ABC transporter permease [Erysipelotrichaceae bacterium]MBQ1740322.1 ABC transporter permease [Erysipelotrichaceae bacterium]MBQ1775294.1 ABC transporter permease [Erysipelotrichaceae bacterium]MBQ1811852.1 ABC transporter permease [Erysipelotrichaceae bacterium]
MLKYIAKRLVIGALTLLILSTITFFGVRAMPGDPFSQDNKVIAAETYEAMKAKFHLDKPLPEQYFIFLGNAIRGDFGESISKKGKLVSDIIALRFPVTAKLGAIAFCVSMVVGLAFGIIAALAKHRWVNSLITVISTLGVSLPNFLFAIMIMIIFAVKLGWLPIVGLNGPQYYILPVAALSLGPISSVTRLTRSSIRDVMHEDYITLSRSKGNKETRTIIVHGLKNALLPVVTYAGPLFAGMITGSLVIETLFSVPGIGAEFTNSITNRDYTLVMGLTILFGVLVIIMNLISDIVAAIIDPRIKLGK